MADLLGTESRKIHPKLRLFANGSPEVNAFRAEQAAALRIEPATPISQLPILRTEPAATLSLAELLATPPMPPLQKLAEA